MAQQGGRVYTDRVTLNPPPDSETEVSSPSTVNFYAIPEDPNGILDGDVGDRAWQINSTNKWVCNGGTSWSLDDGGGGGGGDRWQVTWTPGATPDPDTGLYATFATAHAAAEAIAALGFDVDIVVGASGGSYEIAAGTYDMSRISLIGYPAYEGLSSLSLTVNTAAAGVVFTNFTRGISFITLRHDGSDPLCEIAADTHEVSLGHNATWRSTAGLLWDVTGGAAYFDLGARVNLGAAEDPGVALVNVDAGASVTFYCLTQDVIRDVTSGAGQVEVIQGSGSVSVADQTVLTGPFSHTPAVTLPVMPTIILRAGSTDPGNGIYATWTEAYNAATNLSGKRVRILVDNPGGFGSALTIPNGTFDMSRIELCGYTQVLQNDWTPTHWLTTSANTVFQNFYNGISYLAIWHAGSAALCTMNLAAGGKYVIPFGAYGALGASTAEVFRFTGTGVMTFLCQGAFFFMNGGSDYEITNQTAGSTLTVNSAIGGVSVSGDVFRGAAASTLQYSGIISPIGTQANYAGTITPVGIAGSLLYTADNPADWSGSAPATIGAALDRIAAALGPIA